MAATTQSVIDAITDVTKDVDRARWTLAEISRWMNHGQSMIASIHVRAASEYVQLTLAAGARQDLRTIDPSKSWVRLFELVCNVEGTEPTGETIRAVARSSLDFVAKTWRGGTLAATVKEYALDERQPFAFDVFPPVTAGTKVLALASIRPGPVCVLNGDATALVDADETIGLADGFEVPLIDYVLFRLFSKDANDPSYASRAAMHLQMFQLAVGVEVDDAKVK